MIEEYNFAVWHTINTASRQALRTAKQERYIGKE